MTPNEIQIELDKLTWADAHCLIESLNNILPPHKRLNWTTSEMKKDFIKAHCAIKHILSNAYDWLAWGN